jgi:cell division protein FtsW
MARFRRRQGDALPDDHEVQLGLWDTLTQRANSIARAVAAPDPARPAFVVLGSVLALFVVGFLLQASHAATTRGLGGYEVEIVEQARFRAAALVCLLMGLRLGPQVFRRIVPHLFAVTIFLLIAVWIPGLAAPQNGASRWVEIFGFSLQPSEIARVVLVLWTADRCARMGEERMATWGTILPMVATGLLTCLLVFVEPDLGGSLILLTCFGLTLWVGGASAKRSIYPFLLVGLGVASVAYTANGYVRGRVDTFLMGANGGQVTDADSAILSGGWAGEGLGQGAARLGGFEGQQAGFIHQESDFVFSLIGEELGLFGMWMVIGLYACIAWFGLRMVLAIPDRFRALSAFGLLLCVLMPALIHMMVAVDLAPTKGMTLPFLSHGGSSLIMSSLACGLALGAARATQTTGAASESRRIPMDRVPESR